MNDFDILTRIEAYRGQLKRGLRPKVEHPPIEDGPGSDWREAYLTRERARWEAEAPQREARNREWVAANPLVLLGGCANLVELKRRYRKLAMAAHPDRGGSHHAMVALNKAFELAQRFIQ